jgi:hypothetical protein
MTIKDKAIELLERARRGITLQSTTEDLGFACGNIDDALALLREPEPCKPDEISEFVKQADMLIRKKDVAVWEALSALDKALTYIEQQKARLKAMYAGDLSPESRLNGYSVICKEQKERIELQAERIRELEEQSRWIPVSERLPKVPVGPPNASSEKVWLIWRGEAFKGYYTNFEGWRICGAYKVPEYQKEVTHWKPIILPEQALKGD